ncbi:MAG: hypothetical protein GX238_09740 [Epulopiscium sp.]|nr:hypothetical protein [Candidatus Epulonipiscium sp.]
MNKELIFYELSSQDELDDLVAKLGDGTSPDYIKNNHWNKEPIVLETVNPSSNDTLLEEVQDILKKLEDIQSKLPLLEQMHQDIKTICTFLETLSDTIVHNKETSLSLKEILKSIKNRPYGK